MGNYSLRGFCGLVIFTLLTALAGCGHGGGGGGGAAASGTVTGVTTPGSVSVVTAN